MDEEKEEFDLQLLQQQQSIKIDLLI